MGILTLADTGTGPLWFVQTLLGFSILAALVAAVVPRTIRRAPQAAIPRPLRPARTYLALLGTGLGVGVLSFVVRQRFPLMTAVSNLQLGFFTQYIVYFVLGMAAGRSGFLDRLTELSPRPWYWSSLGCVLLIPVLLVAGGAFDNGLDAYTTGLRWQALAYALWEQATAVVFSMALLLFARRQAERVPVPRCASPRGTRTSSTSSTPRSSCGSPTRGFGCSCRRP